MSGTPGAVPPHGFRVPNRGTQSRLLSAIQRLGRPGQPAARFHASSSPRTCGRDVRPATSSGSIYAKQPMSQALNRHPGQSERCPSQRRPPEPAECS